MQITVAFMDENVAEFAKAAIEQTFGVAAQQNPSNNAELLVSVPSDQIGEQVKWFAAGFHAATLAIEKRWGQR